MIVGVDAGFGIQRGDPFLYRDSTKGRCIILGQFFVELSAKHEQYIITLLCMASHSDSGSPTLPRDIRTVATILIEISINIKTRATGAWRRQLHAKSTREI